MRKFSRSAAPDFLNQNAERWGLEWENRRKTNPGAKFVWPSVQGDPINKKLVPLLKALTQDHCSFCDNFPVSPPSIDTIEHFKPKARFPKAAYIWENLYYACMFCQQKNDDFEEDLLRPDAEDYDFDRYFSWDFTLGTILPNPKATEADKRRAEITIRMYRLNDGHPVLRKQAQYRRSRFLNDSLEAWPYRDFIQPTARG